MRFLIYIIYSIVILSFTGCSQKVKNNEQIDINSKPYAPWFVNDQCEFTTKVTNITTTDIIFSITNKPLKSKCNKPASFNNQVLYLPNQKILIQKDLMKKLQISPSLAQEYIISFGVFYTSKISPTINEFKIKLLNNLELNKKNNHLSAKDYSLFTVYFEPDKYTPNQQSIETLKNMSNLLLKNSSKKLSIKIIGHTDKTGTNEYNFNIGLKRAQEVKKILIHYGFTEEILTVISHGESNPICNENNTKCHDLNRRVEIKVSNITKL